MTRRRSGARPGHPDDLPGAELSTWGGNVRSPAHTRAAILLVVGALMLVTPVLALRLGGARAAGDPVIAAAGDIACDPSNSNYNGGAGSSNACRDKYTSDILVNGNFAAVLALGDNQYYCGSYTAYGQSFGSSWGRVKSLIHPSVGNHEYLTSGGTGCDSTNAGAAGYFQYFGSAAGQAGKGYYSFNVGSFWHLIALNSNCGDAGGCSSSSPQYAWLQSDLAANKGKCLLAYWHIPLFSSGGRAASNSKPFWDLLYAAHADVVVNGHDHIYERFAPQNPSGGGDATNGILEIIAGTGGANHTSIAAVAANSVIRNASTFGVLELTLHPSSYDWTFVPEAGATFTDSGSAACHAGGTADTTKPSTPANLTATAVSSSEIDLAWSASTDNVGIAGYYVYRGGTKIATVTSGTSYKNTGLSPSTTYTYTVSAFDAASNESAQSSSASATTPAAADSAPTTPTGVQAIVSGSTVTVSWNASSDTDSTPVAGYRVYRDTSTTPLGSTNASTLSYADQNVPAGSHTYYVTAYDTASPANESAKSAGGTVNVSGGTGQGGGGGIQLIQQTTGSASGTSVSVTPSAPTTGGDTLVAAIAVKAGSSVSVSSMTDSSGATWTKGAAGYLTGANSRVELWYRAGAPSVTSVTATLSASNTAVIDLTEWSGVASSSPVDNAAGGSTASGTTASTPSITRTNATDLVIGAINYPSNVTSTLSSSSFSALSDFSYSTTVHGRAAYTLTTTTGNSQVAWTLSGADGGSGGAILALKAGSAPPTDTTPPTTTISCNSAACAGSYSGAVTVALSATDNTGGSGVKATYYTSDGSDPTTSPTRQQYTASFTLSSSATVKFYSLDNAGNAEAVKSQTITIVAPDTTPPTTTISCGGRSCSGTFWNSVSVSLSATDTGGSGVKATYYTTDGSDPTTAGTTYTGPFTINVPGTYTVKFYSVDNAGNAETVKTQSVTVSSDTSAPTTAIACNGGSCSGTFTSSVSVTLTANDDASGVVTTYYTTDGTDPTTSLSRQTYTGPFTVISPGATVKYYSVDNAGNAESVRTQVITISPSQDTTPPSTTIACGGGSCSGTFWNSVSVSLSATDTGGSGVKATYYTTDGSDPTTSATRIAYTAPFTLTSTTTVNYYSVDNSGNAETYKSTPISLTSDTQAPTTTITCNSAPCTGSYTSSVTVALNATDNSGGSGVDKTYYTTDGSDPSSTSNSKRILYSTPFTVSATATIKYSSVDKAGNVESPGSTTITISSSGGGTQTLNPIADSYVYSINPSTNYGTATSIYVDGDGIRQSYLRFDLSGLSGTVTGATLKIYANSSQTTGYDVYSIAEMTWGETTITWNNKPVMASSKSGSSGPITSGTWTSVSLPPSLVQAALGSQLNLGLQTTSNTNVNMASRESANKPQLVVTTG